MHFAEFYILLSHPHHLQPPTSASAVGILDIPGVIAKRNGILRDDFRKCAFPLECRVVTVCAFGTINATKNVEIQMKWMQLSLLMLAQGKGKPQNRIHPHTYTHTRSSHAHTIISFQSVYPSALRMTFNPFVLFVVETNYMYDGVGTSLCHRSQKMPFRTCNDCSSTVSCFFVLRVRRWMSGIHGS